MPKKRLRALISLYHQSAAWVTPENLDYYIDRVFAPVYSTTTLYGSLNSSESGLEDLETALAARQSTPSRGGPRDLLGPNYFPPVSQTLLNDNERVSNVRREVGAALWGHDVSGRPGFDTIMDVLQAHKKSSPKPPPPPKSDQ